MGDRGSILVLFDIDGTLIDSLGAGIRGMSRAFRELHGWEDALEGVPIAGRTDRAILRDAFERRGVTEWNDAALALRDAYFGCLPGELAVSGGPAMVLPGVHRALDQLEADPRFVVGLLTGNFHVGARLKLEAAGVWDRFTLGAFGDDHVNRRDLVPVALERARERGWTPERAIVIGDTPLDVDCAHAHGQIAVAVATGHYDVPALAATQADLVVATLDELGDAAETRAKLVAERARGKP